MQSVKVVLLHAIKPEDEESQENWASFLSEAALIDLPPGGEQLAVNVWLLPDGGQAERLLAVAAHSHAIESRCLPFVWRTPWQRLSPSP